MEHNQKKANRLINEKSPYLLQHADNPVDWYPWSDEAFLLAEKENRLIFLSIGYSTCHWCHVMERESFEDPEVAEKMNDLFVNIKVDREERPDIDAVYMNACQMMTGSGGWPLTVILTPSKIPVFAATYLPKYSRMGRIGMMELIERITITWSENNDNILKSAEKIASALAQADRNSSVFEIDDALLGNAYSLFKENFDEKNGGFFSAPKFPSVHNLMFLLRYWKRNGKKSALSMVKKTLRHMRKGGIFDHVGCGFHRYSTDEKWVVPHFEKMLYDQAMAALAYTECYQADGKGEFLHSAREIFTYVLRDMVSPEGAFYSAEDADSEGIEGKYYVWSVKELKKELSEDEFAFADRIFDIKEKGNYRDELRGTLSGKNILYYKKLERDLTVDLKMGVNNFVKKLDEIRSKLFACRNERQRPIKDDKMLTDWNGLMIAALARAGWVFHEPDYVNAAEQAAGFILNNLAGKDGSLLHRFRDGESAYTGTLDDYAFMIWGLLELYQATFSAGYLKTAVQLNSFLTEHFYDDNEGGYFMTHNNTSDLPFRKKMLFDGALPSGNSVQLMNLLRLAALTGESRLEEQADLSFRLFFNTVSVQPMNHAFYLTALDWYIGPSAEVVIVGRPDASDTNKLVSAMRNAGIYNAAILLKNPDDYEEITRMAPFVKDCSPVAGKAAAYICRNHACDLPVTDVEEMYRLLDIK